MQRRRFLQSVGASAIIPLSSTQVVSASNLSSLRKTESLLLKYKPGRSGPPEPGIGDTFNRSPIIEGDKAFIPDSDGFSKKVQADTIIYNENGNLHSTSNDEIEIDHEILQHRGPVNESSTGHQNRSAGALKVDRRGKGVTIQRDGVDIQVNPGEEKSLSADTPATDASQSNIGGRGRITNHGVKTTYWHPKKRLFPLNDKFGEMLNRARNEAEKKGTTLNKVMSTDIIQRDVEVIGDIKAIAIEETHVPYRSNQTEHVEKHRNRSNVPASKKHRTKLSSENRGEE